MIEFDQPVTEERFWLQKRQPDGSYKFLEDAATLEEAQTLKNWWVADAADPAAYWKRLRIVKKTTVTTYSEVK